jgi:hypothetical protein
VKAWACTLLFLFSSTCFVSFAAAQDQSAPQHDNTPAKPSGKQTKKVLEEMGPTYGDWLTVMRSSDFTVAPDPSKPPAPAPVL